MEEIWARSKRHKKLEVSTYGNFRNYATKEPVKVYGRRVSFMSDTIYADREVIDNHGVYITDRGSIIEHIDGNDSNNRLDNLCIVFKYKSRELERLYFPTKAVLEARRMQQELLKERERKSKEYSKAMSKWNLLRDNDGR